MNIDQKICETCKKPQNPFSGITLVTNNKTYIYRCTLCDKKSKRFLK